MKSMYLGILLLCAYVQSAKVFQIENTPAGTVTSNFKIEDVHIKASGPDSAFTKNDQLLAEKLVATGAVVLNFVEERIRELIEGFRDVIINGNDNIPPLDPLLIPTAGPFVVEVATGTRADITIRNFHMDGLRWYVLDYVTFNPLRLTLRLHLTVPWLTFTGNYETEAKVGPLVHRAGGKYRLFFNRFAMSVDMRLGTNFLGGHLLLRDLDINLDVQHVNIRVDGMSGSTIINAFINNLVQNITQDFVQSKLENISQMLNMKLFDIINELLKKYT